MAEFQTVVKALQHWTEKLGDAPAFIFRNKFHERYVLTWNKLYALSGRFAAVLHGWGLTRGHLVVNTLPNSPERVVCEAGILMSGAASVNAQCQLADGSDLLRTLKMSHAFGIVVDPDVENSPWDVLQHHVSLSSDGNSVTSESLPQLKKIYFVRRVENNSTENFLRRLKIQKDLFEADDITSDDALTVFSTSGSTGFSKLVPYTHGHYLYYTKKIDTISTGGKTVFNISPLGWSGAYFASSLLNGSRRVLCDVRGGGLPDNMADFIWRTIQEEKCEMAGFSPLFLPQLVKIVRGRMQGGRQDTETDVKQNAEISTLVVEMSGDKRNKAEESTTCTGTKEMVKPSTAGDKTGTVERQEIKDDTPDTRTSKAWKPDVAILSGSPVTRSFVQQALILANSVLVLYGATDFALVSSLMVRNGDDYIDYDCGPAAKGIEVKIVSQDDEDVEVSANQLGHILVRTQPVPEGYLNDPQMTAAAFTKDGYFRTGDLGRLDHRRHLIVEGRGGDAIMRGAYIFYPGWLEARISAYPGVDSVMIVGVPNPDLHEELCACVVLESDNVTMSQVREFVEKDIVTKENDPLSPRPRYYLKFESFPKTSTDKPQRKAIKKMAAEMLGLSDFSEMTDCVLCGNVKAV